jgi:DNA polymerase III epsilon subunit family exonuclease
LDRPIVFLDTETATLLGAPHLLEIGAVRVVDGEAVDRFDTLVRPQVPIEAEATAIHGIPDDAVRDAPDAGEAIARFLSWLGDDWMAAHGARFDAGVLAFECVRWGLAPPAAPILDTVKIARRLLPDSPDHKLPTLCQVLEIETAVHHRALPDAVSCWKVLEACLERLPADPPATAADLLGLCAPLVTVASAAPRLPRLSPRLRPIEEALRSRARITVLYGEAEEVSRLSLQPRILFESRRRGYMEAECARSGLLKTYRLDRVRRILENA